MDWDVGQGGVAAIILETGSSTATNRAAITVRYDTQSPTAAEADTVWVEAKKDADVEKKKRTAFKVSWSLLKFTGNLHGDNALRYLNPPTGINTAKCEFNWDGDNGATKIAAKMEATVSFLPIGIKWSTSGISWKFSEDGGGAKSDLMLHRQKIATAVDQTNFEANRKIALNDGDWNFDGNSDTGDAQYPTDAKPNNAFRIDWPGFDPDLFLQSGFRADLRELVLFHNGTAWGRITAYTNAKWYANCTAVLPTGTKGGTNNHGTGSAENVPNTKPVANARDDETVTSAANVQLDGHLSTDADDDPLTYKWTQTAGANVTLSDSTAVEPTFTAPAGPDTLKFDLKVTDITVGLSHHKPTNSESVADSVTITVNAP